MAREQEGLTAGDVEFAPVPFAPPQAVPDRLPIQLAASQSDVINDWRCSACNKKLAESAGPGSRQRCRCGTVNSVPMVEVRTESPHLAEIVELRSQMQFLMAH